MPSDPRDMDPNWPARPPHGGYCQGGGYALGGHVPSLKGKHPGSVHGPEMRGGADGFHYLAPPEPIEATNRVHGAPETDLPGQGHNPVTSPRAVDRSAGYPTSGRTPYAPYVRGYAWGGLAEDGLSGPPPGEMLATYNQPAEPGAPIQKPLSALPTRSMGLGGANKSQQTGYRAGGKVRR